MCHGFVRFVLARTKGDPVFRFAPIGHGAWQRMLSAEQRDSAPDSVVLLTDDDELLFRSDVMVFVMQRLGGLWHVPAMLLKVIPRLIRDVVYDWVARVRKTVFGRTPQMCPVVPDHLKRCFDLS
ncbi:MAG: DUF393 domain-containing protein [Myxococcales bacterium]|nr:MAG: DUF393 domain-containing protein [Myxococcales bacterium]